VSLWILLSKVNHLLFTKTMLSSRCLSDRTADGYPIKSNEMNSLRRKFRGLVQRRLLPQWVQRMTWNHEYAAGEWDSRSLHTPNDPIYEVLLKYCSDRDVCDIGSGHGNTVVELPPIYRTYTGVDISDVALGIAAKRAAETGRQRVTFIQGCMHTFKPTRKVDVFLFRESLMYVCRRRSRVESEMSSFLHRYASMLAPGGIMVVRLCTGTIGEDRLASSVEAIVCEKFSLIERRCTQEPPSLSLVFRPVYEIGSRCLRK